MSSTERWAPVPGYEGLYEVSDEGRVRSLHKGSPLVLKQRMNEKGYFGVRLWRDGVARHQRVNRLVAMSFLRPPLDGEVARHLNGDQQDNRAVNLKWGTATQNVADSRSLGRLYNQKKTHCPQRHPYSDENTVIVVRKARPSQERVCRQCRRASRMASR